MIRRAVQDDAYLVTRLLAAMWDEMQPTQPADSDYRERLFVYWYETIGAGTTIVWLATEQGRAIGMVALLLHVHPPMPISERRRGYITAMYVEPEHRRQGHGRALMDAAIAFAQEQRLQRLELSTSEMARPLYEALGFRDQTMMTFKTGG